MRSLKLWPDRELQRIKRKKQIGAAGGKLRMFAILSRFHGVTGPIDSSAQQATDLVFEHYKTLIFTPFHRAHGDFLVAIAHWAGG